MSKHKTKTSPQTVAEAEAAAKATQRPGQTKQETKLIAQGIQKGIEYYKKQHKAKSRELDKRLRKTKSTDIAANRIESVTETGVGNAGKSKAGNVSSNTGRLPWVLLVLSWCSFGIYLYAVA